MTIQNGCYCEIPGCLPGTCPNEPYPDFDAGKAFEHFAKAAIAANMHPVALFELALRSAGLQPNRVVMRQFHDAWKERAPEFPWMYQERALCGI